MCMHNVVVRVCVYANVLQGVATSFVLSKFAFECRLRFVAPTATKDMCHVGHSH